jgi:sulfate/thiosulfate transport system substrate-binding protein
LRIPFHALLLAAGLSLILAGCRSADPSIPGSTPSATRLTLAAYTTPREAYGEIIPLFRAAWFDRTGQMTIFEESYLGSGAQARAVAEGFEADIVALSLEADVTRLQETGLITHDWKQAHNSGMVSTSVVVFAVRAGNPLQIQDWADLTRPGVEVLTPNPQTSGGAMWNILALYGAALRGQIAGIPAGEPEAATAFLIDVLRQVTVMDKAARDSMINFETGVGDVAITYENEVRVGRQAGQDYELVIPSSTILIENPVAVVDVYASEHGTLEAARAFVDFLFAPEAQHIFARHGLRSVDPVVAQATSGDYPAVPDLFTIEYFGGWAKATSDFFGQEGIFTRALLEAQVGR